MAIVIHERTQLSVTDQFGPGRHIFKRECHTWIIRIGEVLVFKGMFNPVAMGKAGTQKAMSVNEPTAELIGSSPGSFQRSGRDC